MPFVINYGKPESTARAAEAAGAQVAYSKNVKDSLEAQQTASLQSAKLQYGVAEQQNKLAHDVTQRQADRQHDAAKTQYETDVLSQWRERQLELQGQQQAAHDKALAEVQEKQDRAAFVRDGLKSGALEYDATMRQDDANDQRSLAKIERDPTISPDHKQQAMQEITARIMHRRENPRVRLSPPQSLEDRAANEVLIYGPDGKRKPLGQQQPGDLVLVPDRNNTLRPTFVKGDGQTAATKPQTVREYRDQPDQQAKLLADALRRAQEQKDAARTNALDLAKANADAAKTRWQNFLSTGKDTDKAETAWKAYETAALAVQQLQQAPPPVASMADAIRLHERDNEALMLNETMPGAGVQPPLAPQYEVPASGWLNGTPPMSTQPTQTPSAPPAVAPQQQPMPQPAAEPAPQQQPLQQATTPAAPPTFAPSRFAELPAPKSPDDEPTEFSDPQVQRYMAGDKPLMNFSVKLAAGNPFVVRDVYGRPLRDENGKPQIAPFNPKIPIVRTPNDLARVAPGSVFYSPFGELMTKKAR